MCVWISIRLIIGCVQSTSTVNSAPCKYTHKNQDLVDILLLITLFHYTGSISLYILSSFSSSLPRTSLCLQVAGVYLCACMCLRLRCNKQDSTDLIWFNLIFGNFYQCFTRVDNHI